jgi:hypothetical protein
MDQTEGLVVFINDRVLYSGTFYLYPAVIAFIWRLFIIALAEKLPFEDALIYLSSCLELFGRSDLLIRATVKYVGDPQSNQWTIIIDPSKYQSLSGPLVKYKGKVPPMVLAQRVICYENSYDFLHKRIVIHAVFVAKNNRAWLPHQLTLLLNFATAQRSHQFVEACAQIDESLLKMILHHD